MRAKLQQVKATRMHTWQVGILVALFLDGGEMKPTLQLIFLHLKRMYYFSALKNITCKINMYFYHVEISHFMTIQLGIIKFKINSCHKTVKTMHFHFCTKFWSHSFSYRMEAKIWPINERPHRKPQLQYNQENKIKTSRSVSSV